MLVLMRKENESVLIAEDIEIVVLEIKRGSVRLGFNCPKNIKVLRSELLDKKLPPSTPTKVAT